MEKLMTVEVTVDDNDKYVIETAVHVDDKLDASDIARLFARGAWDVMRTQVYPRIALDLKARGVSDADWSDFEDKMNVIILDQADVFAAGLLEALFLPANAIDRSETEGDDTVKRFKDISEWLGEIAEQVKNGNSVADQIQENIAQHEQSKEQ